MAEENTCTICLESLFKDNCTDLGVCNPCGHPYHVSCFRQWEASKMDYSGDRSKVKCPYCSSPTEGFTKIYLSAPTVDYGMDDDDDDDDDSSVSSTESAADVLSDLIHHAMEDEEEEEEDFEDETEECNETAEEGMEGDQPERASNQSAKHNAEQEKEEEEGEGNLDVVDLTASPEPKKKKKQKNSKTATTSKADDGIQMKRKMKHYRKQTKQLKSRLQESSKQSRQLLEKHNEMKRKVKEAEQSMIEYEDSHAENELELQQKRLENVTLKRQLTKEKQDLQRSQERYRDLSLRFSRFEKASNDRLEQIRKSHNVETQKMLAEYPKLQEDNKRLAETNEKQKKYLAEIKSYMKKLDPDIRERVERNVGREPSDGNDPNAGIMTQRQLKEGLKTFQDMTEGIHKRKRTEPSTTTQKLASNPRVARIAGATEQARAHKKAHNSSRRNVDELFGKLDHRKPTAGPAPSKRRVSTDSTAEDGITAQRQQSKGSSGATRERQQSRVPLAPSLNLSASSKRKPVASNRTLFPKKSKGNGDIRAWF